jgi:hypothetical protein
VASCLLHDPPLEIADSRQGRWMLRHLETAHGLRADRWPDGAPVVYDPAITVEEFLQQRGAGT